MTMYRHRALLPIAIVLMALHCLLYCLLTPPPASAENNTGISLTDVEQQGIIGKLNYPIGTIINVSGTIIKTKTLNPYYFKNIQKYQILLNIEKVDGLALETPVQYEFQLEAWTIKDDIRPPNPGATFNYWGYEWLRVVGIPDGAQAFYKVPRQGSRVKIKNEFIILGLGPKEQ